MNADGSVTYAEVARLRALASRIRTTAAAMHDAARPLSALAGTVQHLVGGTATGKDREFVQQLAGARAGIEQAIAGCSNASGGVERAAAAAEADAREHERQRRRV